jgi:acetylornithine deacetylase
MNQTLDSTLSEYVAAHRERLVALVQDLVRCPSENKPPVGAEGACQRLVAERLRAAGYQPDVYALDTYPELAAHPLFMSGRDYAGRPNVAARRKGAGGAGGRSLVLSGHIDTVPRGAQPWTRDAFGGEVDGNRLYGRGSNDMKAGLAANLFVMEALSELKLRLSGDLMFESVVDEEFGGANGTLAGRVRGYVADAAVVTEPSSLRICAAQRGGWTAQISFSASGGILTEGTFPAGVVDQVTHFLNQVKVFAAQRRANARSHPMYAKACDPVPVAITKIFTGPWGTSEPITVPEQCQVEMYWQLMPGERQADVEREFHAWFDSMIAAAPGLFLTRPLVAFPLRCLPGSAIDASEPLIAELAACAEPVLGRPPVVVGIEGPCDMFIFHQFGMPAVLWGPNGGNTHAADEYVEIDSVVATAGALLAFVCRWCGVAD